MLSAAFAGGYLLLVSLLWGALIVQLRRPSPRNRLQRLVHEGDQGVGPISLCVPVRNEVDLLEDFMTSMDRLVVPGFEVVVVDDNSTDTTREKLAEMASTRAWIRVVDAGLPPVGWSGKAWAMHRGAAEAQEDLLLFLDVDVELSREGLSTAVCEMKRLGLQLLSLRGETRVNNWRQGLLVPGAEWLALGAVDLNAVNASVSPEAHASETFVLVERVAFEAVGGFAAVRQQLLPATGLTRVFNQRAKRFALFDAQWVYSTGRDDGFRGRWARYRRRLYQELGRRPQVVLGLLLFTGIAVLLPFAVLVGLIVGSMAGLLQLSPMWLSWSAGVCSLVLGFRWIQERNSGRTGVYAWMHPVAMVLVAFNLLVSFLSVETTWKDRKFWDGRVRTEGK